MDTVVIATVNLGHVKNDDDDDDDDNDDDDTECGPTG